MESNVVIEGVWLWVMSGVLAVIVAALGVFYKPLKNLLLVKLESLQTSLNILKIESFRQMYDGFKQELVEVVGEQVMTLNQMYVNDWKAAAADGKLTDDEIQMLRNELVKRTKLNLTHAAREFFEEHVPSLDNIIQDLAEAIIDHNKSIQGKSPA